MPSSLSPWLNSLSEGGYIEVAEGIRYPAEVTNLFLNTSFLE